MEQIPRHWGDDEEEEQEEEKHEVKPTPLSSPQVKQPPPQNGPTLGEPESVSIAHEANDHDGPSLAKKRKKSKKTQKGPASGGPQAESGFQLLGQSLGPGQSEVRRVLPPWLTNPNVVTVDFEQDQLSVADMPGLDPDTVAKLRAHGIHNLFPVQRQVIPGLLSQGSLFRPSDICVSAPTGSGKTLAYVIPTIQSLKRRLAPSPRVLVVLPVQELASQVFHVFQTYAQGTNLKVKLLTPQRAFEAEQNELVQELWEAPGQFKQLADIVITTPGRLVDHLTRTRGLDWHCLRYLIIDEADRVMENIQYNWLAQLETRVGLDRVRMQPFTVCTAQRNLIPLQKLLFSATLSQNPEYLDSLNLFEPRLFTSVVKPKDILENKSQATISEDAQEFVGQYTTPAELNEALVIVKDPLKKPMILAYLLRKKRVEKAIVFTNSIEHAHYLSLVLKQYGFSVGEMSSQVSAKRGRTMNQFQAGKFTVLVSTDALARGMDLGRVDFVISYDTPKFIRTYIHRVGRTARAGTPGHALTLVEAGKAERKLRHILKEANKTDLPSEEVDEDDLDEKTYQEAMDKATTLLNEEKARVVAINVRNKKKNFKKRK
ncbi:hypothetical protein TCAL_11721 [Tigriopus californicus]|uniref:ATP-dependent RNA helicase n=2 Tax=Tigriopus californicus TaxID=6832 RepID=A0A553NG49_TIGCA|nr:ATP-dependent RNA helicase DDX51-like isoform X2 [Tigriopus californicus]TRY64368.1 hypothetical protein TCAL_11721 [Tigriopus californicus]|eukprot:TCALIF_11721-PA protein Name:"Similar to ddx51 ATP-dependent RNA helicase DDX51 (Danio rerio)" AED:0.08 eAED:0.09 QI:0/0/0/1/1/1/2/0/599